MGKIINTESTGKERNTLMRGIVAALRELIKQNDVNAHSYDLVAYIGLSLLKIESTVDQSVIAWEKRDYWVKADRFRMEWAWTGTIGKDILSALKANDWAGIAQNAIKVGQKLSSVKVTERSRIGTPWVGAYQLLQK